jgi:hypothetical protein
MSFQDKKWQIEVKIYMPLFWRENKIGLVCTQKKLKKRVHELKKQDAS